MRWQKTFDLQVDNLMLRIPMTVSVCLFIARFTTCDLCRLRNLSQLRKVFVFSCSRWIIRYSRRNKRSHQISLGKSPLDHCHSELQRMIIGYRAHTS
jgi:hypothetical protein